MTQTILTLKPKVKQFKELTDMEDLEVKINNWLAVNHLIESVQDVKYSTVKVNDSVLSQGLVFYYEKVIDPSN